MNYTIDSQLQVDKTIGSALVYLIASGKGMSFAEDYEGGNDMNLSELSLLIIELKADGILPANGKYMQYTAGGLTPEQHYGDDLYTKTKILIFDETDQILQIIPNHEIFALRDGDGSRCGIKESGFRRLIHALL